MQSALQQNPDILQDFMQQSGQGQQGYQSPTQRSGPPSQEDKPRSWYSLLKNQSVVRKTQKFDKKLCKLKGFMVIFGVEFNRHIKI